MRITIIVDASFCPKTNAAGYGYWLASERGKEGGGGSMKGRIVTSVAAEMLAVCNALYRGRVSGLVQPGDHILLQTDCIAAIEGFREQFRRLLKEEQEKDARRYLMQFRRDHNLTLSFRHVKGHSNKKGARYVTNNLCDQRAREGMRLARKTLKKETQ